MDCPYRGIQAYRFVDHRSFVGRDSEVRKLSRLITLYRGVLLFGPSGVGKSSLLEAGLFPVLVEEGFEPNRLRVQPVAGEELVVERIGLSTPGAAPYLPSSFILPDPRRPRPTISARHLHDQAMGWKMTRAEDEWSSGNPPRVPLIVVDQFEELVTLFADERARDARHAVVDALTGLIEDEAIPVKLLFAFRDDYLARLDFFFRRSPYLRDRYVQLGPISRTALRRVIAGGSGPSPRLDRGAGSPLSAGVVDAVFTAASSYGRETGPSLSDVQVACAELWRRDWRRSAIEDEGFQALVESHLRRAVDGFSGGERDTTVVVLRALVTPSGSRAVVPSEHLLDVARRDGGLLRRGRAHVEDVLRKLELDAGLIRREARGDVIYYEIVSEYLVPWIDREHRARMRRRDRARIIRRSAALVLLALLLAAVVLAGVIRSRTAAAIADDRVERADSVAERAEGAREEALRTLAAERERFEEELRRRSDVSGQLLQTTEDALQACRRSLAERPVPAPPEPSDARDELADCRGRLADALRSARRQEYPAAVWQASGQASCEPAVPERPAASWDPPGAHEGDIWDTVEARRQLKACAQRLHDCSRKVRELKGDATRRDNARP
jgi:hypothetical protein